MTQTPPTTSLPAPPVGVPAWLIRLVAALVGIVPAVLAWIDPGNRLPHGGIQAAVILGCLLVGAVVFLIHLVLAATHEYGWNMNAVTHIDTEAEAELKALWPEFKQTYEAAKPALDQIPGVQGAIDAISADVTALKAKGEASGLTPDALISAFEAATGQPWPFPKVPAQAPAAVDPAVAGQTA